MSLDLPVTSHPRRGKAPLHPDVVVGASRPRSHGMEMKVLRATITRRFTAADIPIPPDEARSVQKEVM